MALVLAHALKHCAIRGHGRRIGRPKAMAEVLVSRRAGMVAAIQACPIRRRYALESLLMAEYFFIKGRPTLGKGRIRLSLRSQRTRWGSTSHRCILSDQIRH